MKYEVEISDSPTMAIKDLPYGHAFRYDREPTSDRVMLKLDCGAWRCTSTYADDDACMVWELGSKRMGWDSGDAKVVDLGPFKMRKVDP